ncbi:hypothetical protein [Xanthomonas theicola]|uniref:Uncharacterized protein n=1 Tax=Xanthomonas theicola TaxID=56464 RepID=A0A2S6ZFM8_9XANT|nr:hypothetical protein [Xanthomonas theicola]PPT90950.1 hypothetical protein XthCFBP4691_09830 [Xanthomonas theicola]QNH26380.1 hypothetical protein G4Q83_18900 [Xanthomonas theicola]
MSSSCRVRPVPLLTCAVFVSLRDRAASLNASAELELGASQIQAADGLLHDAIGVLASLPNKAPPPASESGGGGAPMRIWRRWHNGSATQKRAHGNYAPRKPTPNRWPPSQGRAGSASGSSMPSCSCSRRS